MQTDTTHTGPTADDVAKYLRDHPDFFEVNADLLASIKVPNAHGGRAISLQERQLEVMREKNRGLEMRLAELVRNAQENDAIIEKLQRWTRSLLLTSESEKLPAMITDGLSGMFAVPQVALRLWGVREPYRQLPNAVPVEVDVITLANSMKQPYCGPNVNMLPAAWLPEGGVEARSVAMVPLRKGLDPNAFGLLVMGSADADRFRAGMGTTFLDRIGEIASASLSRLVE